MKKRMAVLIATLLLTAAGGASAEQRAGAFTVSPFVGGYTFDGTQHLETRPVYGLRLGYDITKNWGVEATLDYVSSRFTGGHGVPGTDGSINQYNARLEGIYNFMPESKFVPFIAVGAGGSHINTVGNTLGRPAYINNNNDATANAGLGFKYFLSEDAALRFDTRAIMSLHADPSFEISKHDYWINYEYTVGVEFLFGGQKPAVAKVEPPPPPAEKKVEPPPPPVAPPPAPVDCQVSAWSDWSPCINCAQTRTRSILTQAANGGAACPADLKESQKCSGPGDEEKVSLLIEWKFDKPAKKDVKLAAKYLEKTNTLQDVEKQLDMVGAFLQKNSTMKVEFNGWTDSVGTAKYNKALAQRRAEAIKKYLVNKFKIEDGRITAIGQGISTKYDNKTAAGRERNRRTEMTPVTTNKCQ